MEEATEKDSKITPSNQVKITDVLFITLKRWPWLLLSLALCVGAALYYVLRTPPMYTRTASIVIKSSSTGKSISDISAFSEMGLVKWCADSASTKAMKPTDASIRRYSMDRRSPSTSDSPHFPTAKAARPL